MVQHTKMNVIQTSVACTAVGVVDCCKVELVQTRTTSDVG